MVAPILALMLVSTPVPAQSCNVQVHEVDADTGTDLKGVSVILYDPPYSHGSLHTKSDPTGRACLDLTAPSQDGFLVGTSSFRYRPVASFPKYKSVPQDVTTRLRRISVLEAIKDAIGGP